MTATYLDPNGSGSSGILAPLEVVAQWPKPNYVDPVRRPKVVVPLVAILGSIMIAVVGARMWARFVIQKNARVDDWFMLFAMIPTIGFTILIVLAIEVYGFDLHIWDVSPSLYALQRKIVFIVYLLYIVTSASIKISILLFYRRLDARCISSAFRLATWLSIGAIGLFVAAFTIVLCTGCYPLAAFWNQFDVAMQQAGYKYHCWYNEQADIMAASIISAVQDAITALLPTLLYWNLHIPRRQKIALGAVFASGYLIVATCIVRVYMTWEIFNNPLYDGSWTAWPALLLIILEVHLGAIVASVPALKIFARHYFGSGTSAAGSSARFYYGSGRGTGAGASTGGGPTDGSIRHGEFQRPLESGTSVSSVLSRKCEGDEDEGDLALLELPSETKDRTHFV